MAKPSLDKQIGTRWRHSCGGHLNNGKCSQCSTPKDNVPEIHSAQDKMIERKENASTRLVNRTCHCLIISVMQSISLLSAPLNNNPLPFTAHSHAPFFLLQQFIYLPISCCCLQQKTQQKTGVSERCNGTRYWSRTRDVPERRMPETEKSWRQYKLALL